MVTSVFGKIRGKSIPLTVSEWLKYLRCNRKVKSPRFEQNPKRFLIVGKTVIRRLKMKQIDLNVFVFQIPIIIIVSWTSLCGKHILKSSSYTHCCVKPLKNITSDAYILWHHQDSGFAKFQLGTVMKNRIVETEVETDILTEIFFSSFPFLLCIYNSLRDNCCLYTESLNKSSTLQIDEELIKYIKVFKKNNKTNMCFGFFIKKLQKYSLLHILINLQEMYNIYYFMLKLYYVILRFIKNIWFKF